VVSVVRTMPGRVIWVRKGWEGELGGRLVLCSGFCVRVSCLSKAIAVLQAWIRAKSGLRMHVRSQPSLCNVIR
jgi:hypothetical protein